ncbi:MAG: hypothetical protein Ta2B_02020 [Termitinemataceae bacterium]|nr:MAG: hypothetical protein Ta2B_02020 [Termitinemataceae bacterium]
MGKKGNFYLKTNVKKKVLTAVFFLSFFANAFADNISVIIKDALSITTSNPEGITVPVSYNDAALITLTGDTRFMRGIEIELTAPQLWLPNQGSLAVGIYSDIDPIQLSDARYSSGNSEIRCRRLSFEPLPGKLQTVYQVPLRNNHGLRTTPYVSVIQDIVDPSTFPLLVRVAPLIKQLSGDLENMRFMLTVKPLFGNEGLVAIKLLYPNIRQTSPVSLLVDDKLIEPFGEIYMSEGEHFLTIVSNYYRNESRRFIVERGKIQEVSITLRDLSPSIIFEAPARSLIFIDGNLVSKTSAPVIVTSGIHEVKIQLSDYTIVKTVNIQKGRTYRVAFTIDLDINEE